MRLVKVCLVSVFLVLNLLGCADNTALPVVESTEVAVLSTPNQNNDYLVNVADDYELKISGQPEEIRAENCGGLTDFLNVIKRNHNFTADVSLGLTDRIAAELGGDALFAKALIRGEVERALGIKLGVELEVGSELHLTTAPNTETIHTTPIQDRDFINKREGSNLWQATELGAKEQVDEQAP